MDIQHKMLQFEQLYEKKRDEISRGREELQGLLDCVEKMGHENEAKARQLEEEQKAQTKNHSQLMSLQKELEMTRDRLNRE